jgi:hypothetical protein
MADSYKHRMDPLLGPGKFRPRQGARKVMGDDLKVAWAQFSTLS